MVPLSEVDVHGIEVIEAAPGRRVCVGELGRRGLETLDGLDISLFLFR